MRRLFILLGFLALMVSCRKEVLPQEGPSGKGEFEVSLAGYSLKTLSRGTQALSSQGCSEVLYVSRESCGWTGDEGEATTKSAPVTELHDSFGCSAYGYSVFENWTGNELPTVFFNRKVVKDGSAWNFVDGESVRWPGATQKVRFFAYSPYGTENPKMTSGASDSGAPVIGFTCGTDVANQVDLLECASDSVAGNTGSAVSLTFRHALAAVRIKTNNFGFNGKITSVEISGVMSRGSTVIGSDVWTGQSDPVSYTITPALDVSASGESEVASEHTVFCIPQTLGAEAKLKVVFTQGGTDYTFEQSLEGEVLKKNTILTFSLGCDPADISSGFYLSADELEFMNTSADELQTLNLKSYSVHSSGLTQALPWTVQYSTNGTTFSSTKPDWITLSATSGSGGIAGEDVSITVNARSGIDTGESMFGLFETERTAALKAMSEVGSSADPVDLSMLDYNGNVVASRSTANCYVVHAPGWYKIPLVFGNAIKAGATNVEAFYTEGIATDFEDSYGVSFTASSSPYVKAHVLAAGKTLGAAELRWCDIETCVIEVDAELMDAGTDCPYVRVHIPQETISECNALVTVKDSDANVAWSWHLWVSGRDLSPEVIMNHDGLDIPIMPVNLGWNGWIGTVSIAEYPSRECYVKFSNSSGDKVLKVFQKVVSGAGTASGSTVYSSAPYYQWGRKDPFIGGSEAPSSTGNITYSSAGGSQAQAHQNPTVHYYNSSSFSWTTDQYYYFWDAKMNTTSKDQVVTKTIYDPCPVGYAVPSYNTFTYFSTSNVVGSFNKGRYFKRNASDATGIFFPASGYRGVSNANLYDVGSVCNCWLATPRSMTSGHNLYFYRGGVNLQGGDSRARGCPVRPAVPKVAN